MNEAQSSHVQQASASFQTAGGKRKGTSGHDTVAKPSKSSAAPRANDDSAASHEDEEENSTPMDGEQDPRPKLKQQRKFSAKPSAATPATPAAAAVSMQSRLALAAEKEAAEHRQAKLERDRRFEESQPPPEKHRIPASLADLSDLPADSVPAVHWCFPTLDCKMGSQLYDGFLIDLDVREAIKRAEAEKVANAAQSAKAEAARHLLSSASASATAATTAKPAAATTRTVSTYLLVDKGRFLYLLACNPVARKHYEDEVRKEKGADSAAAEKKADVTAARLATKSGANPKAAAAPTAAAAAVAAAPQAAVASPSIAANMVAHNARIAAASFAAQTAVLDIAAWYLPSWFPHMPKTARSKVPSDPHPVRSVLLHLFLCSVFYIGEGFADGLRFTQHLSSSVQGPHDAEQIAHAHIRNIMLREYPLQSQWSNPGLDRLLRSIVHVEFPPSKHSNTHKAVGQALEHLLLWGLTAHCGKHLWNKSNDPTHTCTHQSARCLSNRNFGLKMWEFITMAAEESPWDLSITERLSHSEFSEDEDEVEDEDLGEEKRFGAREVFFGCMGVAFERFIMDAGCREYIGPML